MEHFYFVFLILINLLHNLLITPLATAEVGLRPGVLVPLVENHWPTIEKNIVFMYCNLWKYKRYVGKGACRPKPLQIIPWVDSSHTSHTNPKYHIPTPHSKPLFLPPHLSLILQGSGTGPSLSGGAAGSGSRPTRQRITRVNLRDLLFCLENERFTSHSHFLYKGFLK